jgi:hypothetical protein
MAQVRAKGVQAYGIGPARSIEEINSGFGAHGDNERIEEEAFISLVQYMWNVVVEISASKGPVDRLSVVDASVRKRKSPLKSGLS